MAIQKSDIIYVEPITTETIEVALIGASPLIMNSMSAKAQRELLLPGGRKTEAQKRVSQKHDPLAEYRDSVYSLPEGETMLALPATAVKGALGTAALDLPSSLTKAKTGRLVLVEGDMVPVYGAPQLFMCVVRQAGINRAPDIRTRAILPEWAALVRITYVTPMLTASSIINLLSAAGITVGVGDFRTEKGKGNYGRFTVADSNDPVFARIRERGGRAAQEAALEKPRAYDTETAKLLAWHTEELGRRGR